MKIILFGANGQVGTELKHELKILGEVTALVRDQANFTQPDKIKAWLNTQEFDVIVNATAYTAVDKAESEPKTAQQVNVNSVKMLAEIALARKALLIHYSTDYVFDGTKESAYAEDDKTCPLSVYGTTKLGGEEAIQATGCNALIFRTSWVYSHTGNNFLKTILRFATEKTEMNIVSDQVGVPTAATFLAKMTVEALLHHKNKAITGPHLYHLVPKGKTNWADFAAYILTYAKSIGYDFRLKPDAITPIPTTAYPTPATRPLNSCLKTDKFEQEFNERFPEWQSHVNETVDKLLKISLSSSA